MNIDMDILGVGVCAPGLPDWNTLLAAFDGASVSTEKLISTTTLLSERDRRRAPATAKLSLAAAEQACNMAGMAPDELIAIFSTGMGDMNISDYMCRILAKNPNQLSPTQFHNSVHNAASGYWSIAVGARGDVTALCGGPDSVTVGLIEASSRVCDTAKPILLVMYDDIAVGPLRQLFPTQHPFATALLLSRPMLTPAVAQLSATAVRGKDSSLTMPSALQDRLDDNPAARVLPLLALIGACTDQAITLGAEQGPSIRFRRRHT